MARGSEQSPDGIGKSVSCGLSSGPAVGARVFAAPVSCRWAACTSEIALRRRAQLSVQDPNPGSVSVVLPPARFLIRESGQPSQMTPIGASQVSLIDASQRSGDGAGNSAVRGVCH